MRDGVHPPGGRLPTEADLCRRFEVSRATVRTHLEHIYEKLEVTNRVEAVTEGLRKGLIEM